MSAAAERVSGDAVQPRSARGGFFWLRVAIALGLIAWLWANGGVEFGQLLGLVSHWPVTLAALGVLVVCAVVTSLRLPVLLAPVGYRLPALAAVRLGFIGMFFGVFLPGSAGGDLVKIYYSVSEHDSERTEMTTVMLLDRALGMLAMLAWPLLALPFFASLVAGTPQLAALMGAAAFFTGLGAIALFAATRLSAAALDRIGAGLRRLRLALLERVMRTVAAYRGSGAALWGAFGISLVAHTLSVSAMALLAVAILPGGFEPAMGLLMPLGFTANALPVTPGGLGVGEAALDQLFALASLDGGAELMLGWRALLLATGLAGLAFYLDGRRQFIRMGAKEQE